MKIKSKMSLGIRLILLLAFMGVGLIAASVIGIVVARAGLLAMLTVQDVMAFILPAIAAMALWYDRPMRAMGLERGPSLQAIVVVILFAIVSLPAMNWLVKMNESMTLPSWLAGLEQAMRSLEDNAADATRALLDIHSIGQFISTVFVVGFMAGLSEEILFRGAMLRLMRDSRLGSHAAVWIVAIVFSAIHLQFFGFIPRVVLGLWLGYLLVWTRSLWVPIIAHTLNNSVVVIFSYMANLGMVSNDFGDNIGIPPHGGFPWLALVSFIASVALAVWAARHLPPHQPANEPQS